jgi:glycosyltransferase involved in cell wall biosynthesis
MNRAIVPEAGVRFLEPWLAKRNPRMVFDFDDAIHHVGDNESKLRFILPHFACVTAGNEYLASFARQVHQRVEVWPTVVDTQKYHEAVLRRPGPIRIGWSGSRDTLKHCLPLVASILRELRKTERFEFLVIAEVPPLDSAEGLNITYLPWTPETEVQCLQQIDIGLMPLEDKPFERGKCGLKAIQYMGCGTPALVSPVGVNEQIVKHGETGFHCRTIEDWVAYLRQLIHNPAMRTEMGRKARERVEQKYSISSLLPRMVSLFQDISTSRSVETLAWAKTGMASVHPTLGV